MLVDSDRALASALLTLPEVIAVSLGGSRALGTDDEASDTDLYAWYRGTPPPAEARGAALRPLADGVIHSSDLFGPEDHFAVAGRLTEVVHLDLDALTEQARVARTEGLGGDVCATAFLHTAFAGIVVADPSGALGRFQADLAHYPEATRERQLRDLPQLADEYASQLTKAQLRGDWPMVVRRRAALVDVLASVVFAVNRRYHPGEKRLLAHLAAAPVRPDDLTGRLETACLAPAEDLELAPLLVGLIGETVALG